MHLGLWLDSSTFVFWQGWTENFTLQRALSHAVSNPKVSTTYIYLKLPYSNYLFFQGLSNIMHIKMERRGVGAQISNQITFKGRQLYVIPLSQDNFKCHKHIWNRWQLLESLTEYHIYLMIMTSKFLVITNQTRAELRLQFSLLCCLASIAWSKEKRHYWVNFI